LAFLLLAACAPASAPVPEPVSEPAPLPGDNYALVYAERGKLRYLDTRAGRDRVIADGVTEILMAQATPSGNRVVVAFAGPNATRAVMVNLEDGAVRTIRDGVIGERYTAAWSTDGSRLGVGFRGDASGGILVLDPPGDLRTMGCRASNQMMAWQSATRAIVHGGANHYTVSASDCATISTLQRAGKREITYSVNAGRASWYVDRSVTFQNTGRADVIPELWIANGDGSAARVIADYQSQPRHAVLSPDGRRIAYEVVSRRWANTTHVVIYDIAANDYVFVAEEKLLGVPSDFGVCWSLDGTRIAHDRVYARAGAQPYTTRQVVVRRGTEETEVFDEAIVQPAAVVTANRPGMCQWIGNTHLLVRTERGDRVIDVSDGETYEVPAERHVLGVMVLDQQRDLLPAGPP
jgi:hypothetical protein